MSARNHRLTILARRILLPGLMLVAAASNAFAHKPSDAYLTLRTTRTNLVCEWHLALRDLQEVVDLDANEDGVITWDELRLKQQAVSGYAFARLSFRQGARAGRAIATGFLVDNHSDGAYAVLRFAVADIDALAGFEICYDAFFDMDPSHRGLIRVDADGVEQSSVFGPTTRTQRFDLTRRESLKLLPTFIKEGVWHIWGGYDHVLFLLALLLPGVLRRGAGGWVPLDTAKTAYTNVLKIVTAFTLAHSLTLSLAALGVVRLPERVVESAIAASVVLAALNNIVPFFAERGWMVAFGFGLIHGFGFANALRDLGLRQGRLALTLFGFNSGVELGQLVIVALFLPVAFALRHLLFYRLMVLRVGSVAIMAIAAAWFAERLFDFKCLPF